MNPGRQRGGNEEPICWQNNRSADLINKIIGERENIILTNACQYREMTELTMSLGIEDLTNLIIKYKPVKVICLGVYADTVVKSIGYQMARIKFAHPSFILRFAKDVDLYTKQLREELDR